MKHKGTLILSITAKDCDWQYFRVGGNGGQHRDKTSSGVRVVHRESGATGQATEDRKQSKNRQVAFKRMTDTLAFKKWLAQKLLDGPTPEERVERDMEPHNLLVEGRENGTWQPIQ